MTADVDLFALYGAVSQSAFRLEARSRYAVPAESAQLRAFEEGKPLPPDPRVAKSMRLIRSLATAGKHLQRVHILDRPLITYLRYELRAYAENVEAGEEVRIADRSWHSDLAGLGEDFVLFDAETDRPAIVWMHYDNHGRVTGREYSDREADVQRGCRDRDVAFAHSVSLDEFNSLANTG